MPVECYCVMYLRERLGVEIRGDAWKQIPNKTIMEAAEGDVLLTSEGGGHAALIVGFEGEQDLGYAIAPQYILVQEANYTRCKAGMRRIPWGSPAIRGVLTTQQAGPLSTP